MPPSESPSPGITLWCDGAHDPAENMRRDAALLAAAVNGELERPVLRLFQFAPHGITLGLAQDPAEELDLAAVAADAIPWAIRPTGGRAIFHAEEWTFSLAARLGPDGWASDARAAYARTCEWFAAALQSLGVPAGLARAEHGGLAPRAGGAAAPPCFASTARHELTLEGRKFAGIAQRRQGGALLQQGSLLLGDGHLRLVDYQRMAPEAREPARRALAASAADAAGYIAGAPTLGRLADALGAQPGACVTSRLEGEAGVATFGIG